MMYPSDFKTIHRKKDVTIDDIPWRGWFSIKQMTKTLDEYCMQGSLHGLKYIRDPSIPRADRIFWLIIFLGSLYVSAVIIWAVYSSGSIQQFEMTFNPVSTPIWDIPFPAILVCSVYPVRKSVYDLEQHTNNTKFRQYSKLICPAKEEFGAETLNEALDEEFFLFMNKVAIPCEHLIVKCIWNSREKDCCTLFKPIITEFGQCYTFNNIPGQLLFNDYSPPPGTDDTYDERSHYWEINTGYANRNGKLWKTTYPYWSEYAGESFGFTIDLMDNREEWQQLCTGGGSGYKLKLFSPIENPEVFTNINIPNKVHTQIILNPVLIHSEKDLSSLPQEERGCLFQDEYPLEYFKMYSQSACYMECYIKILIDMCGCVPFNTHRYLALRNHVFCAEPSCEMQVAERLIQSAMIAESLKKSCFCLPACSTLSFEYQSNFQQIVTSHSKPPWVDSYNSSSESNIARVSLFFGVQQFNSMSRRKTSSIHDFLGNCGGLLGLLLGFSFMSAIEVVYFTVIRPTNKIITYIIKYKIKL